MQGTRTRAVIIVVVECRKPKRIFKSAFFSFDDALGFVRDKFINYSVKRVEMEVL